MLNLLLNHPVVNFFIGIAVAGQTTFLPVFLPLFYDLLRQNILFSFTWTFLQTVSQRIQKSDFTLACENIASGRLSGLAVSR